MGGGCSPSRWGGWPTTRVLSEGRELPTAWGKPWRLVLWSSRRARPWRPYPSGCAIPGQTGTIWSPSQWGSPSQGAAPASRRRSTRDARRSRPCCQHESRLSHASVSSWSTQVITTHHVPHHAAPQEGGALWQPLTRRRLTGCSREHGVRGDDLRHFLQGLLAQLLAHLASSLALAVAQPEAPLDLTTQDPVLCHQVLIA